MAVEGEAAAEVLSGEVEAEDAVAEADELTVEDSPETDLVETEDQSDRDEQQVADSDESPNLADDADKSASAPEPDLTGESSSKRHDSGPRGRIRKWLRRSRNTS